MFQINTVNQEIILDSSLVLQCSETYHYPHLTDNNNNETKYGVQIFGCHDIESFKFPECLTLHLFGDRLSELILNGRRCRDSTL